MTSSTSASAAPVITSKFTDIEISESLIRRFDTSGPRYTSYPTADRFYSEFREQAYLKHLADRAALVQAPPLSVYVHLPFCQSLCYFCACNKIITQDTSRSVEYLDYLEKEMALVEPHLGSHRLTRQLHLGGGTPTFGDDAGLQRLMDMLRQRFQFSEDAEISIEIDPRTISDARLAALADMGFNRTSFGVQDFDPDVQKAVNRIQPLEMVEQALESSRKYGFGSINLDLIYGLPRQSLDSFGRTLDHVIRLRPERIALYNYAHLPQRFKAQRLIKAEELPSAEERLQIFLMATRRLLDAGYVYIGLDHFALPDDELSRAGMDGSLHRNFQGYTTRAECDMMGFGVSSIGKVGRSYSQAVRSVKAYYQSLDDGVLPIDRGYSLSDDDLLRRDIIMTLMCSMPVDFDAVAQQHGIDFRTYFADELTRLQPYAEAGLIQIADNRIAITAQGRLFVRAIGMVFDAYLGKPTTSTYSRLI